MQNPQRWQEYSETLLQMDGFLYYFKARKRANFCRVHFTFMFSLPFPIALFTFSIRKINKI